MTEPPVSMRVSTRILFESGYKKVVRDRTAP